MEHSKTVVNVSPRTQDRIIDQVLVQSGGVGLGVVLSIVGAVAIAWWLGLKPAILGWVEKQKIEGEALKDLSIAFRSFTYEHQLNSEKIKDSLTDIKESLTDIKESLPRKR